MERYKRRVVENTPFWLIYSHLNASIGSNNAKLTAIHRAASTIGEFLVAAIGLT